MTETPDPGVDSSHPTGAPRRRSMEEKMPRALWVRIVVYVVGAHFFAAFLYLLFTLGAHNR